MARPKLGEGDTQRLQLKISEEELKAIEDWRFENRVPSRSEAVRRLCAVALVTLNALGNLRQMAEDASVSALEDHEHIGGHFRGLLQDAAEGKEHGFNYSEAKNLLHDYSDRAYWQEQNARYINRVIAGLSDAIRMFANPQNFAVAEREANDRLTELDAFVRFQHEVWDAMDASHSRSAVLRSLTEAERSQLDAMGDQEDRIEYLDSKVAKYKANRRRRQNRLREKIRTEDARIRQLALDRFRSGGDAGSGDDEEEGK